MPSGTASSAPRGLEWLGVLRCLRDTGMQIVQMRRYAELPAAGKPPWPSA